MIADYHIHTEFSDDSATPMEAVVERALAMGFAEICFTDHVDYGIKRDHDALPPGEKSGSGQMMNVDYPAYFSRIAELREKYRGRIAIKQGLEFGVQVHTIPAYQKLFEGWELDFVLLSCHQVEDTEFWNYAFQQGRTQPEYNARYYEEIYECVKRYKGYSVLGHLDMIQRYNGGTFYPFEASRETITQILKQVIADGKGIEVNTSSFRYQLPDLTPERDILRLYRELGGTVITIGSDAHKAESVGEHIPFVQNELKALGFTKVCTFEKMRPVFHDL